MPGRPQLVDNLADETTHAKALSYLVGDIPSTFPLSVGTGYVNLAGLHHLAQAVGTARAVRLLLGAAPDPGLGADLPLPRFQRTLEALRAERDLSRFPPSRAAARLTEVESWLQSGCVEVRRYLDNFLHGKAYLFGTADDGRAALVTSANLTGGGLFHNLELGLVHYDPGVTKDAVAWFDRLWEQAGEYLAELLDLLFPDPGLVDPQTVYLRALLELYGEELERPVPDRPSSTLDLAVFQRDGYERASAILAAHHGVVYADGVGTGKTEIGLAFIEEYALRRGHHALVVAPAQLTSMWEERIDQARLPAQVVSYNAVAVDEQLAPRATGRRRVLHNARDSYRLVIVDEGHSLRNPDTTWYRAMERLLGGERKDLVLLTATPINNGLWDLYHLVMLFARHDRAFAAYGIPSVRALFVRAGASERDPANLNPDVLFPLADAVSVRRERRFIETHYPDARFPDGTPVRFPRPRLETQRYDLDATHAGLFYDITGAISDLTMARYTPTAYLAVDAERRREEQTLAALLQSAVLKRFESCWSSCLLTVRRMIAAHDAFLAGWDSGVVPSRELLRQAALDEVDEAGVAAWVAEELADDTASRSRADFRLEYRIDVEHDRRLLVRIRDRLSALDASTDVKLALLQELIEQSPSEKVAIFSSYGDTVAYLNEHLPERVGDRERVVVIGSETDPDTRTEALARFSPQTVVRPDYIPPDGEVDLLISTDVLSEGQNLQQAGAVISYDMPWNPQRVVQRNGRVIRLKSPHEEVFLTTMLPEPGELEQLLGLEARIRAKIVAAGVFGMESEVIEGVTTELKSYADSLQGGDPRILDVEESAAGVVFSGEELRSQLLRAVAEGEIDRLRALPWGIGAAFHQGPNIPSTGSPGVFFACRTSGGKRYWRFVESEGDGDPLDSEPELLRRINPGSAPGTETEGSALERAWQTAALSIVEEHNEKADPLRSREQIGPAQRFALDLLRDPTVALPLGGAEAAEALAAARSSAVRQALSAIRQDVVDGSISRDEAAIRIVGVVDEFGLQPVEPPPLLEPIASDDIGVVCWMAVLPEAVPGRRT